MHTLSMAPSKDNRAHVLRARRRAFGRSNPVPCFYSRTCM
jgi:hypothetical protein